MLLASGHEEGPNGGLAFQGDASHELSSRRVIYHLRLVLLKLGSVPVIRMSKTKSTLVLFLKAMIARSLLPLLVLPVVVEDHEYSDSQRKA